MQLNKKTLQIIIHIAVWTGFLLLPFLNFPAPDEMPFYAVRKFQFLFFTTNLLLVGFYYLHSLVLIPNLLAERKIVLYIGSILLLLVFFMFLPNIYFYFVEMPKPMFLQNMQHPGNGARDHIGRKILPFAFPAIVLFLLILIVSGGIKIINHWFASERRTEEIEKEKISTELALLRSQVNPHFLFNTLNNIYSLAVTGNPDTATSVMKLSSIMRYALDDVKSNKVQLQKEIDFLENYISLQKVRLTEKTAIHFSATGTIEDQMIAPLLLIAFVENAFKHGVSAHQSSVIEVHLTVTGYQLLFMVANQKFQNNQPGEGHPGVGLTNTGRRLELMYHNKHSLTVVNEANSFLITLTLDLYDKLHSY